MTGASISQIAEMLRHAVECAMNGNGSRFDAEVFAFEERE
jgi:hypothetical protein